MRVQYIRCDRCKMSIDDGRAWRVTFAELRNDGSVPQHGEKVTCDMCTRCMDEITRGLKNATGNNNKERK